MKLKIIIFFIVIVAIFSGYKFLVKNDSDPKVRTEVWKDYWYDGSAEVSTYELEQARYGEMHDGNAVLIYVTETFSKQNATKTSTDSPRNTSVLKLNFTKNFITGIYPYSIMTSVFYPVKNDAHAFKVTSSSQEWCGHTFTELLNKSKFEISTSSYFEGENEKLSIAKEVIEDELWTQIRLHPESLPVGDMMVIPSMMFLRLRHIPTDAYNCKLSLEEGQENTMVYTLNYAKYDRKLSIVFEKNFPYKILSWEEAYPSGSGDDVKKLTTKAKLLKTKKVDYWNKNKTKDAYLRDELGLK